MIFRGDCLGRCRWDWKATRPLDKNGKPGRPGAPLGPGAQATVSLCVQGPGGEGQDLRLQLGAGGPKDPCRGSAGCWLESGIVFWSLIYLLPRTAKGTPESGCLACLKHAQSSREPSSFCFEVALLGELRTKLGKDTLWRKIWAALASDASLIQDQRAWVQHWFRLAMQRRHFHQRIVFGFKREAKHEERLTWWNQPTKGT